MRLGEGGGDCADDVFILGGFFHASLPFPESIRAVHERQNLIFLEGKKIQGTSWT